MNTQDIVEKIKFVCKSQNLKINALLRKAGVSPNLVDDWQNDRSEPSFPTLIEICNVLNITLEELFITDKLSLTSSQERILNEWKNLSNQEKRAIFDYIVALKSNH